MEDDASKERIMELYDKIKKFDNHALALELASMATSFAPFVDVEQMIGRLGKLSTVCRKMKAGQTRDKKAARLKELCAKADSGKKLTKVEHQEALKLCKDLKIKL